MLRASRSHRDVKFARIIACLGWTGIVAGLVGFILMGALPMGQQIGRAHV